jgi:glutaredoxin
MRKYLIGIMILSLLIVAGCSGSNTGAPDSFAQCLTQKEVIMYGTDWCPHCKDQKALFGDSFKHINYVDCDARREECIDAGVKGFPTWVVDGNLYSGTQALQRLSGLTDCDLNPVQEQV